MIDNLDELCWWLKCRGEPWLLNRRIYNRTECGASISLHYDDGMVLHNGADAAVAKIVFNPDTLQLSRERPDDPSRNWKTPGEPVGFSIQTIIEGTDGEITRGTPFLFPVDLNEVESWITEMEGDADDLYREIHFAEDTVYD